MLQYIYKVFDSILINSKLVKQFSIFGNGFLDEGSNDNLVGYPLVLLKINRSLASDYLEKNKRYNVTANLRIITAVEDINTSFEDNGVGVNIATYKHLELIENIVELFEGLNSNRLVGELKNDFVKINYIHNSFVDVGDEFGERVSTVLGFNFLVDVLVKKEETVTIEFTEPSDFITDIQY